MKILLPVLALLLLSGCASPKVTVQTKDGHLVTYSCPRIGGDTKIDQIELEVDGVRARVVGYKSETIQAFQEGAKVAVGLMKP